jgi:hypothetical protein
VVINHCQIDLVPGLRVRRKPQTRTSPFVDHTGLDRPHLRGSCPLHHDLIIPAQPSAPSRLTLPKHSSGADLKPIVAKDIGGCHKGSRARDTDCEEFGENLPHDIHGVPLRST